MGSSLSSRVIKSKAFPKGKKPETKMYVRGRESKPAVVETDDNPASLSTQVQAESAIESYDLVASVEEITETESEDSDIEEEGM